MSFKALFSLTLLTLLSGCINMSVLEKKGHTYVMQVKNLTIDSVKPSKWRVGKRGRQTVHKGVKVKVNLPQISKSDLAELVHKRGIDSVVIGIDRIVKGTRINIGYLNVPIGIKGKIPKNVLFFVDYYAAGVRPSHTKYICPPYGHDFIVSGISVSSTKTKSSSMTISSQYEKRLRGGKNFRFLYNGQRFVAGKDVLGQYYLKLGLYSSREKILKGEFINYQNSFKIDSHKRKSIRGCSSSTGTGVLFDSGKFKWKR